MAIAEILNTLNPDQYGLLKLISTHITDEMLKHIAQLDYGYKAEENFILLKNAQDKHEFPLAKEHFSFYEVLCLGKYWDENLITGQPKSYYQEQHLERAFCCLILLVVDAGWNEDYYHFLAENDDDTLISLIKSITYLGKDFQMATISFLSWKIPRCNSDYASDVFSVFALIYTLLKVSYPIVEKDLHILVKFLYRLVKKIQREYAGSEYVKHRWHEELSWLINLATYPPEKEEESKWLKITQEIPSLITHLKDKNLVNDLKNIAFIPSV